MADIFVIAPNDSHVITHAHLQQMKNQAIVCNIGHCDNEINVAALRNYRWENVKLQVDPIIFPDGERVILLVEGRLVKLGCEPGHASFVMHPAFANHSIVQIERFTNPAQYPKGILGTERSGGVTVGIRRSRCVIVSGP